MYVRLISGTVGISLATMAAPSIAVSASQPVATQTLAPTAPCAGPLVSVDDIPVSAALERTIEDVPTLRFIAAIEDMPEVKRSAIVRRIDALPSSHSTPSPDAGGDCRVADVPYATVRAGLAAIRLWALDGDEVGRFTGAASAALDALAHRETLPAVGIDAALAPFGLTLADIGEPVAPVCVPGDVRPRIVSRPKLHYPEIGVAERQSVRTAVRVTLDAQGSVVAVRPDVAAVPADHQTQFDEETQIAAALARFSPATHDCTPEAATYLFHGSYHFRR